MATTSPRAPAKVLKSAVPVKQTTAESTVSSVASFKNAAAGMLTDPSWDVLLALSFFAITFFYSFWVRKARVAASITSTYIAYALFAFLPLGSWIEKVKIGPPYAMKIGILGVLIVFLTTFLGPRRRVRPSSSWWQVLFYSLAEMGLLIYIALEFLPSDITAKLTPFMRTAFLTGRYRFAWIIIPLLLVIVFRPRESTREE